jgi:signal transduction histidine kinase
MPERFFPSRSSLFRRYAAILMGVVGGALVLQGLLEMAFAYRESLEAAARVQHAVVHAAADRIGQHLATAGRQPAPAGGPSAGGGMRLADDVVTGVSIGRRGHVYAVDGRDRLVAHPDGAFLLKHADLSSYTELSRMRREIAKSIDGTAGMFAGRGLDGSDMMLSAARVPATQWMVVAEQPRGEVLEPLYQSLVRTLWVMGAGLLAALSASYFLARRLVRPIVELQGGAAKIAGGELATRIRIATGDEVEALADEFNRMADQLQDYTTGLERKVAEKTAELEMANRHKSEFLANMSHELRTPLNAIIGFSEVLKERMFGELNPKQLEYVRDIYGSGQHLLSLINDILDLTKVEAGHMELDARDFSVRAAIHNCCTLIRERALRKRLRLESHVFEDVGTWRADERKFKQVVLNLLSNAVKFTPSGGEVRIVVRIEGDTLVVAVSDTGIGVAAEDHERIFHSFQQASGDEEARREGSGLGLALSRRLVERHGGTLVVASSQGHGATFVARFPRLAAAAVVRAEVVNG